MTRREFMDTPSGRWWRFEDMNEVYELRISDPDDCRAAMRGRWVSLGYYNSIEEAQEALARVWGPKGTATMPRAIIRPTPQVVWRNWTED